MKHVLCWLMLVIMVRAMGQTPAIQWSRALGGTLDDMVLSFRPTTDNGSVIGGVTASKDGDVSGSKGKGDIWVAKLDANGNRQWQKVLGGSNEEQGAMVYQATDGGYIVGGNTLSTSGDVKNAHGGMDIWIVKLNSTGSIQWQKALGGSNTDEIVCLQQTADGGYLVGGQTLSVNGDVTGHHGDYDIWFVKLSSAGSIQWTRTLGGSGTEKLAGMNLLPDGGFVFSGSTHSGDVTGFHAGMDLWVGRISASGDLLWNRALGGSGSEGGLFHPVQKLVNGNFVVGSYYGSNDGDLAGIGMEHGGWLVCLDPSGTILWQKIFLKQPVSALYATVDGGLVTSRYFTDHSGTSVSFTKLSASGTEEWTQVYSGGGTRYIHVLQEISGGGYIGYGTTSNSPTVPGFHGAYDGWLIRLDDSGQKLWERAYGGSNNDFLQGRTAVFSQGIFPINTSAATSWQQYNPFIQRADGSFLIALTTGSSNGDIHGFHYSSKSGVRFDIWVAQIIETPPVVPTSVRIPVFQHKLYPNPAIHKVLLNVKGEFTQPVVLEFYNTAGQLLHTTAFSNPGIESRQLTVDVSEFPPGVIFYTLRSDSYQSAGKFIKSK